MPLISRFHPCLTCTTMLGRTMPAVFGNMSNLMDVKHSVLKDVPVRIVLDTDLQPQVKDTLK